MLCNNALVLFFCRFFFFNDTATTEIYTLSLHDALPIFSPQVAHARGVRCHLDELACCFGPWQRARSSRASSCRGLVASLTRHWANFYQVRLVRKRSE